jgi:hypothetical protein
LSWIRNQHPYKGSLVFNLKTAKSVGIAVLLTILAIGDEVIE